MITEIREIKEIRKKYGLTQAELARISNVSQSLIAKIESNVIDPAYSKVRQIFDAIEKLQQNKEMKAFEVMNQRIKCLNINDSLKDAIKIMKKYDISQLPVTNGRNSEVVVGLISETIILEALMNKTNPEEKIKEFMLESPPIISKDSTASMVGSLLRHSPLVIVKDKGKTIGVITKADLLGNVYK